MTRHYDVIVVGGGMVGASLVLALRQVGFKIALVEAAEKTSYQAEADYDVRVSAISLAAKHIFEHLGVWSSILNKRSCPYQQMHVWDAGGHGAIHFCSDELNQAQLGYIIENRVIQSALHEHLQTAGLDLFWQQSVSAWEQANCSNQLRLDDGTRLSADLLVAADGAQSKLRTLANIYTHKHSYRQKGLVATVETSKPHQHTAWQRFLPSGPLAFLPLADGRCSIVWSIADAQAEQLLGLDDDPFCAALGEAFDHRLGEIISVGHRAAFPLHYLHAQTYIKPGFVLVGDAAHVVHPLAGQGVNLGLLDVAALVDCLQQARRNRAPIASIAALRPYERNRRGDNQVMLLSMNGIKKLFSSRSNGVVLLRNKGLRWVDQFSSLKQLFMRQAMGFDIDLPPLAQPPHASGSEVV